ncbi:hypothetical protein [Micromonospora chersina]|uniref:Uncharacterized protein n=1 Tax=Micromonospora chersina TaxID=47854 RepID=A0A1C6U958_9ACTN|nr:hypothetical protein [Micromonospora chersina]SCL50635.1 hypothetical protein GA0070603_1032 [Micromonospora chersina]
MAETPSSTKDSQDSEYIDGHDAVAGRQVVYNIIQRAEFRGSATFGVDGHARSEVRQRTGRIGATELNRLDHFFQPPEAFVRLAEELAQERILLLEGRPGSGRRAGAIQLLRHVAPGLPLVSLSPTSTFSELCTKKFHKQGYLLPDKLGERKISRAELDNLTEALTDAQAFLVVTLTTMTAASDVGVTLRHWPAPVANTLLATYLDRHGVNVDARQREETIAQLPADATPSQVVAVGKRLVAGHSGIEALGALSEENAARVGQWFDQRPTFGQLQFIAALAFLDQTTESAFEAAFEQLTQAMTPTPATPEAITAETVIPQQRHDRFTADSLATVTSETDDYGTTGRRVELKQFVSHERLVSCLHERYGPQLWNPLTTWLRTLARRRDPQLQAAIARGVAQLWKVDRTVAECSFLTPWSKGTAAEQLTAALALWWLGLDSRTEDAALQCATDWAAKGTASQRRTSIVAFSGALGLRFPSDALKWMWRSATAATNDKELQLARSSVVEFCAEASADVETLTAVVRKVLALVNGLPCNPLVRRDALRLVTDILAVRCGGLLLPTTCLRLVPDSATALGQLWAHTLLTRPVRRAALDTLCACLRELERGPRDAEPLPHRRGTASDPLIERLGRSILAALPTEKERELLYTDVTRCLQRRSRHDDDRTVRILLALQAAF